LTHQAESRQGDSTRIRNKGSRRMRARNERGVERFEPGSRQGADSVEMIGTGSSGFQVIPRKAPAEGILISRDDPINVGRFRKRARYQHGITAATQAPRDRVLSIRGSVPNNTTLSAPCGSARQSSANGRAGVKSAAASAAPEWQARGTKAVVRATSARCARRRPAQVVAA